MSIRIQRRMNKGRMHYANGPEDQAACALASHKVSFSKRGYPDLTVYNSDETIYGFIEVKPDSDTKLKEAQNKFLEFCSGRGIPCIRWSPDEGNDKIKEFLKGRY